MKKLFKNVQLIENGKTYTSYGGDVTISSLPLVIKKAASGTVELVIDGDEECKEKSIEYVRPGHHVLYHKSNTL